MKRLLILLISVLLLSMSLYSQEVKKEYDRFKDKTSVSLKFKSNRSMAVELRSSFSGDTPEQPNAVVMIIEIKTRFREYQANNELIFLADDEPISPRKGTYFSVEDGILGHKETISHGIWAEDFKKILDAKKLEARIGKTEFTFKADQLKLMRDFYELITPIKKDN